jgi:hypothetical protein
MSIEIEVEALVEKRIKVRCCNNDIVESSVVWIGRARRLAICSDHSYVLNLFDQLERWMAELPAFKGEPRFSCDTDGALSRKDSAGDL